MKVLITGITGFVGSHLAEYALNQNAEVYGSFRWRSRTENVEHIKNEIQFIECELKDPSSVDTLLERSNPDMIFHLAAQSYVPTSWQAPEDTLVNNIVGQVNLFESIRRRNLDPLIHIAGSSEEYGYTAPEDIPVNEKTALRPLSPYAVSKVSQDMLGYQYYQSYNMKIVRTRAFNHTGPRRGSVFVESNFAQQIAEIESETRQPTVFVGNLEAKRDYCDVRDIVKGYWLALQKGDPGEVYNLASGKAWSIQEVLDYLLSMSAVSIEVKQDPARMRPSDVPILCGDSSVFREKTGWAPHIPFEETLKDLLKYWRTYEYISG